MKQYRFAQILFIGLLACAGRFASAADSGPLRVVGTVQPREVVEVQPSVSGMIRSFGTDPNGKNALIDCNSAVKKGDVLAVVDQQTLQRAVVRAKAQLQTAQLGIELAKLQMVLASNEFDRTKQRVASKAADEADVNVAKAAVDVALAKVHVQEATYEERKADLDAAQESLDRCTIRSPIDGIVLDRRVKLGQFVEAAPNQPALFLIAEPKFQVWCSIPESDIGRVKLGQNCRFTVEALPEKQFTGRIAKLRMNAVSTQNMVTYSGEIDIDESHEPLLPYMTAKVEILATAAAK